MRTLIYHCISKRVATNLRIARINVLYISAESAGLIENRRNCGCKFKMKRYAYTHHSIVSRKQIILKENWVLTYILCLSFVSLMASKGWRQRATNSNKWTKKFLQVILKVKEQIVRSKAWLRMVKALEKLVRAELLLRNHINIIPQLFFSCLKQVRSISTWKNFTQNFNLRFKEGLILWGCETEKNVVVPRHWLLGCLWSKPAPNLHLWVQFQINWAAERGAVAIMCRGWDRPSFIHIPRKKITHVNFLSQDYQQK